ncbi:hypothetical protein V5O48_009928 [Marasmius crinis-equi]|uniref:Uncharacterized protein n=1 Tax=Marasmius crinis-equi TaxID=585013 RepID=A0ABR3FA85_9AGAR
MDVVKTRVQANEGGRYLSSSPVTAIAPSPAPSVIQPYPTTPSPFIYPIQILFLSSPLPTPTPTPTSLLAWSTQHLLSLKDTKPLPLHPIHLFTFLSNRGHTCLLERTGATLLPAVPVNIATFAVFGGFRMGRGGGGGVAKIQSYDYMLFRCGWMTTGLIYLAIE